MNLNQLRYFRVLAHTEHFGKAAEKLYITQPSLSKSIRLLEEELNVELFTKSGRNVSLTLAGRVFLEYVEQALTTLKLGASAMQKFSTQMQILSVGCITPFLGKNKFHSYLLELFSGNRSRLDIVVSQTETLLKDLRNDKYEMVFCSYSPSARDVTFIPILELPYIVAMPKDDPLTKCDFILPEQLKDRPMVFNTEPVYSSMIQHMLDYYHISPMIRGSSNEDSFLLRLVADKVGLLITTDHYQVHTEDTEVRPLKQDLFHRYIYLAYIPGNIHSQTSNQIIEVAKQNALVEQGQQPKASDRLHEQ